MKKKGRKLTGPKKLVSVGKDPRFTKPLIVKRKGHSESFDERKVYASCFHAIRMNDVPRKKAEKICEKTMDDMKRWLKGKKEVDSGDIFKAAVKILKKYDKDAAYMYETFRDIS